MANLSQSAGFFSFIFIRITKTRARTHALSTSFALINNFGWLCIAFIVVSLWFSCRPENHVYKLTCNSIRSSQCILIDLPHHFEIMNETCFELNKKKKMKSLIVLAVLVAVIVAAPVDQDHAAIILKSVNTNIGVDNWKWL